MRGGGTEGHPNKKDPVSGREEGTLDTLIRLEREGGRFGGRRNEGEKEEIRYWLGVDLSILLLTKYGAR